MLCVLGRDQVLGICLKLLDPRRVFALANMLIDMPVDEHYVDSQRYQVWSVSVSK